MQQWQVIGIIFLLVIAAIVLAMVTFKEIIKSFDKNFSAWLKRHIRKETESNIPIIAEQEHAAYYHTQVMSLDGLILHEQTFSCCGDSLIESLQGIATLKQLSEQSNGEKQNVKRN